MGLFRRTPLLSLRPSNEDLEPPQIEDISSEGEISYSDQADHHPGTVLNQLLMATEAQADYECFPSPVVTRPPLWKFAEQTPSGSQTQRVTSTPVKLAGPQRQAPARAQPQAPAQMQPLAEAQPPRPAPVYFPQPQAAKPGGLDMPSESLIDEDRLSDFPESEASLIAKQTQSELIDRVANFCGLERGDTEEQKGHGYETSLLT